MSSILARSQRYSDESWDENFLLLQNWERMVRRSSEVWEKIVNCRSVNSEDLDEWEKIELGFFRDDHDVPVNLGDAGNWEFQNDQNLEWVRL